MFSLKIGIKIRFLWLLSLLKMLHLCTVNFNDSLHSIIIRIIVFKTQKPKSVQ